MYPTFRLQIGILVSNYQVNSAFFHLDKLRFSSTSDFRKSTTRSVSQVGCFINRRVIGCQQSIIYV